MTIARALPLCGALLLIGCGGGVIGADEEASDTAGLSVPRKVKVNGVVVDVETHYLPRVVQCENPGAPFEALKAQAIAARTYLTYRSDGKAIPTIRDGESDQVYTCDNNDYGRYVSNSALEAVKQTAGQVVLFEGKITAGFFVAGASRSDRTCKRLGDPTNTERFITFNLGLLDEEKTESPIGYRNDAHNRGAFGQRLANCLADLEQYDYATLLRYFYGSDIQVAKFGTEVPSDEEVEQRALSDRALAACWSATLDRPVTFGDCVQSESDHKFYQCQLDGEFLLAPVDISGLPVGPTGYCGTVLAL